MPYDSFWWQGLDGTKVLTHFSTTQDEGAFASTETRRPTTYNADASPLQVMSTWNNLQQKETQQELLMAFGYGDGGGGPTREMLENIREMGNFPATPQIRNGRARDFFRNMEEMPESACLPGMGSCIWNTIAAHTPPRPATNAAIAKAKSCSTTPNSWRPGLLLTRTYKYPHADLTEAWKLLCLNQFHDILPGSSIGEVYADSHEIMSS